MTHLQKVGMTDSEHAREKFCRLLEQCGERQAQGWQQWRGELLLDFEAEDRGLAIAAVY